MLIDDEDDRNNNDNSEVMMVRFCYKSDIITRCKKQKQQQ